MNYELIIVELFAKIKMLENKVKRMEKRLVQEGIFDERDVFDLDDSDMQFITVTNSPSQKITTNTIKQYIINKIDNARKNGDENITVVAREIHNELKLKNSYPMVCNAMRKCMNDNDTVIHSPKSGYSSTLEIKYHT